MARTLADEIGKKKPFESPEQEAHLNVLRTAAWLSAPFAELFRAQGISAPGYNVLRILRGAAATGSGRRACHEIAEQLVAQGPDVTRLVDRLVAQGLAERCRCDEDRRVVYVQITRKGLELLSKLDGPTLRLHRAQLGHLTREELAELSRLLVEARAGSSAGGRTRGA